MQQEQPSEYGDFGARPEPTTGEDPPAGAPGGGWAPGYGAATGLAPPMQPVFVPGPIAGSNGLGIAGFVVSLVGLFTCGVLWPISLILSVLGMRREPKGLAIAGLVISLVDLLLFFVWMLPFVLLPLILVPLGLAAAPAIEVTSEQTVLGAAVREHLERNETLPGSLSEVSGGDAGLATDPWGTAYRLTPGAGDGSFTIESAGPDRSFGTSDDVRHFASYSRAVGGTKPEPSGVGKAADER